ncbi:hypothetical protein ES705_14616 [subsurface metagenome]
MTIDEAIEVLRGRWDGIIESPDKEFACAIGIGIEAAKGIVSLRRGHGKALSELLPGETKPVYRGMTETMFINPLTD